MTNAGQARSRATARDVAELARCSVTAVSLVVNGKSAGRVKAEIEKQVWQAVGQLAYQVNRSASALARQMPNTVALVLPDPTDPFLSLILDGVTSALGDELTLNLVVLRREDASGPSVQRAMAGDLAGLIVASPGPTLLDDITPICPVIVLDAEGQHSGLTTINPDIESAARGLAEHLVGLGHRRLAYAGVQRAGEIALRRGKALHSQLEQRGAELIVPGILVSRPSIDEAQRAFIAQWPALDRLEVTAVVCGDDLVAYGVMSGAHATGVDVPGRLSVASLNNLPYSAIVSPRLTTVDLSARELGVRGVAALRAHIDGDTRALSETVPSHLVVRESTAAPA
jgi:LacI family transcriptional regulator